MAVRQSLLFLDVKKEKKGVNGENSTEREKQMVFFCGTHRTLSYLSYFTGWCFLLQHDEWGRGRGC